MKNKNNIKKTPQMEITKNEARERLERYKNIMNLSKFNPDGRIELLELWSQRVLKMDYTEAEKWLMSED